MQISYERQVSIARDKGYNVTVSLLPDYGSKDDYLNYFKLIDELHTIPGSKISVKIRQLGVSPENQLENFIKIIRYAQERNVFVWISCTKIEDAKDEMMFYEEGLNKGFRNLGLTLATNNPDVNENVDHILDKGGHIRLVKGYYYTPLTNNWDEVSRLFTFNADKLLSSGGYHVIATHDFDILNKLYEKYGETSSWHKVEFGFFYSALNFVTYMIKKTGIELPNKSLYIPYGPVFNYMIDNIPYLDWKHILIRKIKSLMYFSV